MSVVVINGRYADTVADVSRQVIYLAPAADPNQELRTVPAGEAWELIGASVTVNTSAVAGNRTIRLRVRNAAGNIFYQTAVGANIAASQTGVIQNFVIGTNLAANIFAPAGLIVDAFDAAAIDAAADVINLHLVVREHFSAVG